MYDVSLTKCSVERITKIIYVMAQRLTSTFRKLRISVTERGTASRCGVSHGTRPKLSRKFQVTKAILVCSNFSVYTVNVAEDAKRNSLRSEKYV